ncbi:hypothetical protein GCM10025770_18560 [Viridibacterium curvum]|uniref:NERD domain-containing protein n=2 Tax=Viridibacterium curvum TaxID=1101404 RepID=A0ABP9QML4_9RHOO
MLTIGGVTTRRRWFNDPNKARNNRMLAVQHFDKELKQIKHAVLEQSSDAPRFERGVAALLFLQGFSPAIQLETDAPDIILMTPAGRLVIVECTTRISDFSAKVGKLVDRRGSLEKSLRASHHNGEVTAMLVCALPKDQIATWQAEPVVHQIILVTQEDLRQAIIEVRNPRNPDDLLDAAVSRMSQSGI